MGVSVCLLSQTLTDGSLSAHFITARILLLLRNFKKRKTRNRPQQIVGGLESGWQLKVKGEVQNIKKRLKEALRWLPTLPKLEIEEVCLILDTKKKNCGFILAPWGGPCHARVTVATLTTQQYSHTEQPADLWERKNSTFRLLPSLLLLKCMQTSTTPTDHHNSTAGFTLKNTGPFF